ncbi:MAG: hypothetical protein R3F53_15010 [Gammaproteobacteria bacterium]
MISTLSYRYRIPLALCLISLLTTAVLLAVFAVSAYRSLHEHLTNLAQDVGSALAPSLGPSAAPMIYGAHTIFWPPPNPR